MANRPLGITLSAPSSFKGTNECVEVGREREDLSPFQESHLSFILLRDALGVIVYADIHM